MEEWLGCVATGRAFGLRSHYITLGADPAGVGLSCPGLEGYGIGLVSVRFWPAALGPAGLLIRGAVRRAELRLLPSGVGLQCAGGCGLQWSPRRRDARSSSFRTVRRGPDGRGGRRWYSPAVSFAEGKGVGPGDCLAASGRPGCPALSCCGLAHVGSFFGCVPGVVNFPGTMPWLLEGVLGFRVTAAGTSLSPEASSRRRKAPAGELAGASVPATLVVGSADTECAGKT